MGEKEKEKEKKDKEKKEKEKATVRSAPDGSDNNSKCQSALCKKRMFGGASTGDGRQGGGQAK